MNKVNFAALETEYLRTDEIARAAEADLNNAQSANINTHSAEYLNLAIAARNTRGTANRLNGMYWATCLANSESGIPRGNSHIDRAYENACIEFPAC